MHIGDRIKFLRTRKGMTQKELAKELHIANSTLSQYESGQRGLSDVVKKNVADYFGVTVDYLMGREDDARVPHESVREILAGPGLRLLLDADNKLTEDQLKEIVEFIEFKRRTEDR